MGISQNMSLGLAHRKELQKRRSQRFWLFIKIIFFLSTLIGTSYFSFDTGQDVAIRSMAYNKANFDQQTADLKKLRIDLGNSKAALNKIQKLLPSTEIQDLLLVVNQKAADGISPTRMATVITGLSKDEKCSEKPLAKRIMIATPVSQQTNSTASFYRGLITVAGKGSPTLNDNGSPEAWYDPTKQMTASFTLPGGEMQTATGILPLYYSLIIQDKEYRFTIIPGSKSFADITIRQCGL